MVDHRRIVWCMRRTNIYLEDRQTEAIDRLAADQGASRAQIIRQILDRALGTADDMAADVAAIEATFGAAVGVEPQAPGRASGARESHLAHVWAHQ